MPAKDLSSFLERFVRPLVAGGELHVSEPVAEPRALAWRDQVIAGAAVTEPIDEMREAIAREMLVAPPRLLFDEIDLALAVCAYNALALAHPDTERFTARGAARARVLQVSLALAEVPPPRGRAELVDRHTLLHNLFDVSRQDVTVRWWTGKAEFKGQKPPSRLTAWPGLRNVRVEPETVPAHELFAFDEGLRLVAALLAASPLTDVMRPERPHPGFAWGRSGVVLRDAELARVVAHDWSSPGRAQVAPAAGAAAWERLLHQSAPIAEVRAATAFLVHVGVLLALAEQHAGAAAAASASGAGDAAGPLFWAIPALCAGVDAARALASPPGLELGSPLGRRWQALRDRGVEALGAARVTELRQHLATRLGNAGSSG